MTNTIRSATRPARATLAIAAALLTASPALAQSARKLSPNATPPSRAYHALTVEVNPVFDSHNFIPGAWVTNPQPVGGQRGSCNPVTRSHSSADFGGDEFTRQAGFVDNEIAAASFIIPAAHFPARIDLAEMIFAHNAVVTTTTQWSILVWSGTPDTGTLVAEYSSDGVILPHIVIPPGPNGVNVAVSVDPNDPEQIIVDNLGNATFTVGYRIDRHNLPPANPCLQAPDPQRNAFPTTDNSGLAQPTNNWLFGINCGAFGCPANGGWARFSALPGFCRPNGDWNIRVTYTPLFCDEERGACCLADGSCVPDLTANECDTIDGTWTGAGVTCAQANCPPPTGACCFQSTGGCINLSQANCNAAGGVYQGNGTNCATTICFPTGACCLPDGSCIGPVSPEDCTAAGGVYQGHNSSCATTDCPDPVGACCFSNNFCLVLTQADCNAAGATWHGPGSNCDDANQNGTADACEPPPPQCPFDCDENLVVNAADVGCYLTLYFTDIAEGTTIADCDGNGVTNAADVGCFLSGYFATLGPCP